MYDYLIVGQGLAGTVLAHTLLNQGKRIFVLNHENEKAAYAVSAGLFNPITGKRITKTWMAESLFQFLPSFYKSMEDLLQQTFIYPMPVYKPFATIAEQNDWLVKAFENNYDQFVDTNIPKEKYEDRIQNPYGGFETLQSGYIEVKKMVDAYRQYLKDHGIYKSIAKNTDLTVGENSVSAEGIEAKKIIFCEGMGIVNNPYFNWLPIKPSKGQILEIESEQLSNDVIFNRSAFVLPKGKNRFRAGSTYESRYSDEEVSSAATQDILERIQSFLKVPVKVVDAIAGIRPAVSDRKPLIGLHPRFKTLGIFNGLGTKGVSLAPYFAKQFFTYLENDGKLEPEVSINRFLSKYQE
jgi:glycine oxidase